MTTKTKLPRSIWTNPVHFLAFGCGLGAMPIAPGTFGTLLGIPLVIWLDSMHASYAFLTILILFFLGIWLCGKTAQDIGEHDHSGIVWDEIVGFAVAVNALPLTWEWLLAGFLLFRLFDIVKPWPISYFDKTLEGGLGIMFDDILAGIFAGVILQISHFYFFY